MKIVGYGICGAGEAERYLKQTINSFKKLCDETIICLNGEAKLEKYLFDKAGIKTVTDDREWGKDQYKIKEDFVKNHVSKLNPDITVCLDMDEHFTGSTTRETLIEWFQENDTAYCYIVNLWGDRGYNPKLSFGNVRAWSWRNKDKLGDQFYEFEKKGVHCGLAPKWAYAVRRHAPFVVLHHGLQKVVDRQKKIQRYEKYDPEQKLITSPDFYAELAKPNTVGIPINTEVIQKLEYRAEEESKHMAPPPHLEPLIPKQKETIFIKRQHDGFVFTIEKERLQNQLNQKYYHKGQQYGFELIE